MLGVPLLDRVHMFPPAAIERAILVAADNVSYAGVHDDFRAGDTSRAHAVNHYFNSTHLLADNFQRIY